VLEEWLLWNRRFTIHFDDGEGSRKVAGQGFGDGRQGKVMVPYQNLNRCRKDTDNPCQNYRQVQINTIHRGSCRNRQA